MLKVKNMFVSVLLVAFSSASHAGVGNEKALDTMISLFNQSANIFVDEVSVFHGVKKYETGVVEYRYSLPAELAYVDKELLNTPGVKSKILNQMCKNDAFLVLAAEAEENGYEVQFNYYISNKGGPVINQAVQLENCKHFL